MKKILLFAAFAALSFSAFAAEPARTVIFKQDLNKDLGEENAKAYASHLNDENELKKYLGTGSNKNKKFPDTVDSDDQSAYLPNLHTLLRDGKGSDSKNMREALKEAGWGFDDPDALTLSDNTIPFEGVFNVQLSKEGQYFYLKNGATNKQGLLTLPPFIKDDKTYDNVKLDWKFCPCKGQSGGYDKVKVVVIVTNGNDVKVFPNENGVDLCAWIPAEDLGTPAKEYAHPNAWHDGSFELTGVTIDKNTKIQMRPIDEQYYANPADKTTACQATGLYRFFFKDITISGTEKGSAVSEIAADENAPVEYYNLQGVKVANPENGLFIRVQGNKATKVMIK